MRVLWYWPHPHQILSPGAEPLIRSGDAVTIQCLTTFRGQLGDDPRVELRRELPEVPQLRRVPEPLRRVLRIEAYVRRSIMRERLVRSGRFDVCHVETLNYATDAFSLRRLRRLVRVVAVVHDVVPHRARMPRRIERGLLRRLYASVDAYVVLHEVVAKRLVADFDVDPSRVVVAEHPVGPADASHERGSAAPRDREGPTRFLFFGSLRSDKGIPVLLDAAGRLAGDSSCSIHVAGGGDERLERAVAAAAERGVISSEVGWVSAARKTELFAAADVIVLPYNDPYRFQSQSGVLADAYAYGKPVIVGDVGAIGPTVRADATGWVVPAGDVVALAEQMRRVARDAEARRDAAAAIDSVLPRYSYDDYGRTLRVAYELAIGSR